MRPTALLLVIAAAACGGSQRSQPGAPAPESPGAAVEAFMSAVADSNLTQLGMLWGTPRGPAAVTNLPEWQRRLVVIQAYLQGGSGRVIGDSPTSSGDRRTVTFELTRGGCTKAVPFTTIRLNSGTWLVSDIDLSAAGNPARPCGVNS